jgi:hypothetical protein
LLNVFSSPLAVAPTSLALDAHLRAGDRFAVVADRDHDVALQLRREHVRLRSPLAPPDGEGLPRPGANLSASF